jgi:hypothetical protein
MTNPAPGAATAPQRVTARHGPATGRISLLAWVARSSGMPANDDNKEWP